MYIHLIANAHLDPVWLWDWREGLNEARTTVKTILDLMDEAPELTFTRGEALIYEHIEEVDPALFRRMRAMIEAGRWEVVGGTYVQPDTNLPGAEALARQFTRGQRYFRSRFGYCPRVAWQADSFGHTAGLPEILAAAGIEAFAFTRPDSATLPFAEPAFWWEGQGGARILAYRPLTGWYGSDRDEIPRRLDGLLEAGCRSRLKQVACFYGLGNHGGGPSRRHLAEIRQWAEKHPEVTVIHSTLQRFFDSLTSDLARDDDFLPVHRGELNYCLRGCYASAAKLKFLYRHSEGMLNRAEKTDAVVAAKIGRPGTDLSQAWDGVLFNTFHDILPGTSIERALEDQIRWLGGVVHAAQSAEFRALNELSALVDTTVQPVPTDHPTGVAAFVWNPHPYVFRGHVELEACVDYRPAHAYKDRPGELPLRVLSAVGNALPFQEITTESKVMTDLPWRKRVLVRVSLPALGWQVLEMAWVEGARNLEISDPVRTGDTWIENATYRVEAQIGYTGVCVLYRGKPVFEKNGLGAFVVEDPWGTWGGMQEQKESLRHNKIRETWKILDVRILEAGPERGKLWVRFSGANSRIDLTFSLCRDRGAVDVSARVLWVECSARLKLDLPVQGEAEFEVPGAVVRRDETGDVPGGRWLRILSDKGDFGFASDALYSFSRSSDGLQATVVRGTRYADETRAEAWEEPWRPTLDTGELSFRFLMTVGNADLPRLARELEQPPVVLLVPPGPGPLPRAGSLASLQPESLELLAIKPAEDGNGFVIRVLAPAGSCVQGRLSWMGQQTDLGAIAGGKLHSWKLTSSPTGWHACPIDLIEAPTGADVCPEPKALKQRKLTTRKGAPLRTALLGVGQ